MHTGPYTVVIYECGQPMHNTATPMESLLYMYYWYWYQHLNYNRYFIKEIDA
jgi:hypothetical protein